VSIDLPPVPPPPIPRPKLNKATTLLVGCGLGIGAVAVFAVFGLVLFFVVMPNRLVPKARIFADGIYAKAESNKNLAKEQLGVYGEIAKLIDAPDSSVFAVNIGGAILYDHLKDGAISEEEIEEAGEVRDALNKDPTGGIFSMSVYLRAHPEMQKRINSFLRDTALAGVNAG
jgi:hypothetical protein